MVAREVSADGVDVGSAAATEVAGGGAAVVSTSAGDEPPTDAETAGVDAGDRESIELTGCAAGEPADSALLSNATPPRQTAAATTAAPPRAIVPRRHVNSRARGRGDDVGAVAGPAVAARADAVGSISSLARALGLDDADCMTLFCATGGTLGRVAEVGADVVGVAICEVAPSDCLCPQLPQN